MTTIYYYRLLKAAVLVLLLPIYVHFSLTIHFIMLLCRQCHHDGSVTPTKPVKKYCICNCPVMLLEQNPYMDTSDT